MKKADDFFNDGEKVATLLFPVVNLTATNSNIAALADINWHL